MDAVWWVAGAWPVILISGPVWTISGTRIVLSVPGLVLVYGYQSLPFLLVGGLLVALADLMAGRLFKAGRTARVTTSVVTSVLFGLGTMAWAAPHFLALAVIAAGAGATGAWLAWDPKHSVWPWFTGTALTIGGALLVGKAPWPM